VFALDSEHCSPGAQDVCESYKPELCGRPWDYEATELLSSVKHNSLTEVINNYKMGNWIPSFISPYVRGGELYFAVIFKNVNNASDYEVVLDIDSNKKAKSVVKDMTTSNYRITLATSYYLNGTLYHMMVFFKVSDVDNTEIRIRFRQPKSSYKKYNESAIRDGLSLVSRRVTVSPRGKNRYTTIFSENDGFKTFEYDGLTSETVVNTINEQRRRNHYLVHIDMYTFKEGIRYSAIFTDEEIGECEEKVVSGYNQAEIEAIAASNTNDGFLMTAVVAQTQSSFPLFLGVFRK